MYQTQFYEDQPKHFTNAKKVLKYINETGYTINRYKLFKLDEISNDFKEITTEEFIHLLGKEL